MTEAETVAPRPLLAVRLSSEFEFDLGKLADLQKRLKNFLAKMRMTTRKAVATMIITTTRGMLVAPLVLKGPL